MGVQMPEVYLSLWPPPFEHPPSPLKPLLLPPPPRILTCLLGSWSHLSQRIVGCLVGPSLDFNGCAPSPQILLFATSFLLRSAYHTVYHPYLAEDTPILLKELLAGPERDQPEDSCPGQGTSRAV